MERNQILYLKNCSVAFSVPTALSLDNGDTKTNMILLTPLTIIFCLQLKLEKKY